MGVRRESVVTKVSPSALFLALADAWAAAGWPSPPRAALVLLTAQWALETAWGAQCRNWNLGNAKARAGGEQDWQFFPCDEVLSASVAHELVAADPDHARIEWERGAQAAVAFTPEHPACCFASYPTLVDGASAWLRLQHDRFSGAWTALLTGDARAFGHALKIAGYYTAPEEQYVATLAAIAAKLDGELPDACVALAPDRTAGAVDPAA
jgi:hypothetical protein